MNSDHRPNVKGVVATSGLLVLLLYSLLLHLVFGVQWQVAGMALLRAGAVLIVVELAWVLFEKYGWANPVARALFAAPPDLRGRWVGTSKSSVDQQSRPMALEVRQTYLTVACTAWGPGRGSPGNRAIGLSCRVLSDQDHSTFRLAYLYHASPLDPTTAQQGDTHEGFAILDLHESTSPKELRGSYFNTSEPTPPSCLRRTQMGRGRPERASRMRDVA